MNHSNRVLCVRIIPNVEWQAVALRHSSMDGDLRAAATAVGGGFAALRATCLSAVSP